MGFGEEVIGFIGLIINEENKITDKLISWKTLVYNLMINRHSSEPCGSTRLQDPLKLASSPTGGSSNTGYPGIASSTQSPKLSRLCSFGKEPKPCSINSTADCFTAEIRFLCL